VVIDGACLLAEFAMAELLSGWDIALARVVRAVVVGSMIFVLATKAWPAEDTTLDQMRRDLGAKVRRIYETGEFIRQAEQPWHELGRYQSYGGVVQVDLSARVSVNYLTLPGDSRPTAITSPTYNGNLVGPIIEVYPGDTLKINLKGCQKTQPGNRTVAA
jgi:FtsP/CotA-like multicopper oxidase with cupredoxin domain